jgi:hypothetical protein
VIRGTHVMPGNTDPNRVPDLQCAFDLVVLTARERFLHQMKPVLSNVKSDAVSIS